MVICKRSVQKLCSGHVLGYMVIPLVYWQTEAGDGQHLLPSMSLCGFFHQDEWQALRSRPPIFGSWISGIAAPLKRHFSRPVLYLFWSLLFQPILRLIVIDLVCWLLFASAVTFIFIGYIRDLQYLQKYQSVYLLQASYSISYGDGFNRFYERAIVSC